MEEEEEKESRRNNDKVEVPLINRKQERKKALISKSKSFYLL